MKSNWTLRLASSLVVVAVALVLIVSQARSVSIEDIKYAARRLPSNVKPLEYDLQLTLLEGINAFNEGKVDIFVEFKHRTSSSSFGSRFVDKMTRDKADNLEPRDRIVLNAGRNIEAITNLDISVGDSIESIRRGQGRALEIKQIGRDRSAGTLVISLKKSLPEGSIGLISIEYSWGGQESYDPGQRLDKYSYRVIRIQPGEAREMFPCFDEPHLKANMILAVRQPDLSKSVAWHTTVSHTKTFTHEKHWVTMKSDRLLRTPVPVPLHSITFVIGPFGINGGTQLYRDVSNGRRINLLAPFDKLKKGSFAIDFAVEVAKWLETYLGQPMPMELTLVAVPESESSRAGWNATGGLGVGLINEKFLLVDSNSWVDDKTECLLNVALTVARQWFGNTLTPATSQDFWITEGLAAYMAQRIVRQLRPDFQVDQYVAFNKIPQDDLLSGSNGATYKVATKRLNADDRSRLFRGAQIIDMLRRNQSPSKDHFDAIVRRLFEEFNALDLAHLAEAFANEQVPSNKLIDVMQKLLVNGDHIWIQLDVQGEQLVVKQLAKVQMPVALQVRLVFAAQSGTLVRDMKLHDFVQGETEIKFKFPNHLPFEWAVALEDEPEMLPYYRVRYSDGLLERLAKAFESDDEHALKPHNRLAIISDALDEANKFANEEGTREKFSQTIKLYERERDLGVLSGVMRAIETFQKLFDRREQFSVLARHVEQLLFKRLGGLTGSRKEAPIEQRAKLAMLKFLGRIGNRRAIDEALALFESTSMGAAEPMGYLVDPVHEIVTRSGSFTQRNRLFYRLSHGMKDVGSVQQLRQQLGLPMGQYS